MSIDDEKAKVRRNLVVFCFLYLVVAYLDLSIQQVLNSLILEKVDKAISVDKAVIVSAVIFFYLAWRWFTSDEQSKEYRANRDNFRNRLRVLVNEWVLVSAQSRYYNQYVNYKSAESEKSFLAWFEARTAEQKAAIVPTVSNWQGSAFKGTAEIHFQAKSIQGAQESYIRTPFVVKVFILSRAFIAIRSLLFMLIRPHFWEWFPPVILAVSTFCVILCKWFSIDVARYLNWSQFW